MSTEIYNLRWTNVGSHMGFSNEIFPTLENTINMGMYSVQFFMGNPQSFSRKYINNSDIEKCKKLLKRFAFIF
jgi:endonuclease IV